MCRALGIPLCSYYQWSKQETARVERKAREERLVQKVRDTFEENERLHGKLLRQLQEGDGLQA